MFFLRFERRHLYKENGGNIDSVQTSMSVDLCSRRSLRLKFREPGGNGGLGSSLKQIDMARPFRTRSTGMLSSNMSLREGSSPCLQCQSQMIATSCSFCYCRIPSRTILWTRTLGRAAVVLCQTSCRSRLADREVVESRSFPFPF